MNKLLIAPALALALTAFAGASMASNDDPANGQGLKVPQATEKLASQDDGIRDEKGTEHGYKDHDRKNLKRNVHEAAGESFDGDLDD